jgi:hypothetical protein
LEESQQSFVYSQVPSYSFRNFPISSFSCDCAVVLSLAYVPPFNAGRLEANRSARFFVVIVHNAGQLAVREFATWSPWGTWSAWSSARAALPVREEAHNAYFDYDIQFDAGKIAVHIGQ